MSDIEAGSTIFVVDEVGATFAFATEEDQRLFFEQEERAGAEELVRFTLTAPSAMSFYEAAEHACRVGPEVSR